MEWSFWNVNFGRPSLEYVCTLARFECKGLLHLSNLFLYTEMCACFIFSEFSCVLYIYPVCDMRLFQYPHIRTNFVRSFVPTHQYSFLLSLLSTFPSIYPLYFQARHHKHKQQIALLQHKRSFRAELHSSG